MRPEQRQLLLKALTSDRWSLGITVGSSLVRTAATMALPLLIRKATSLGGAFSLVEAAVVGLAGAFLVAVHVAAGLVARAACLDLCMPFTLQLRRRMLQDLIHAHRRRRSLAYDHDLLVQDSDRVNALISLSVGLILPSIPPALAALGLLLWIDPQLCAATVLFAIPAVALSLRERARFNRAIRTVHATRADLDGSCLHLLKSAEMVRLRAAFDPSMARFDAINERHQEATKRKGYEHTRFITIQTSFVTIAMLAVLVVGCWKVAQGKLSVSDLLTFLALLEMLRGIWRNLANASPQVVDGLASFRRLTEPVEVLDWPGTEAPDFAGPLRLSGIRFSYVEDSMVLDDLDLEVPRGQMVVLAGPNGAGKSTLLRLVLGFEVPSAGTRTLAGVDYSRLDLAALRAGVGLAVQDTLLFQGSLRENLRLNVPDSSDAELHEAMRQSGLQAALRDGARDLDQDVGQFGEALSAGQRQAVALARAFLGDPPILILDEPESHLDEAATEALLLGLREMAADRMVLISSHDPRVLQAADRAYRLQAGRLEPWVPGSPLAPAASSMR